MNKKLATTTLFTHGSIELVGIAGLLLTPVWFTSIFFPQSSMFEATLCCLVLGPLRLLAGYALISNKSWSGTFAILISIATLILSPILVFFILKLTLTGSIVAFILDIPLALTVLVALNIKNKFFGKNFFVIV